MNKILADTDATLLRKVGKVFYFVKFGMKVFCGRDGKYKQRKYG